MEVTQHDGRIERHDHELAAISAVIEWMIRYAAENALVIALRGHNQIEAIFGGEGMTIV